MQSVKPIGLENPSKPRPSIVSAAILRLARSKGYGITNKPPNTFERWTKSPIRTDVPHPTSVPKTKPTPPAKKKQPATRRLSPPPPPPVRASSSTDGSPQPPGLSYILPFVSHNTVYVLTYLRVQPGDLQH